MMLVTDGDNGLASSLFPDWSLFRETHRMSGTRVGVQFLIFAGSLASAAALGILGVLSIAQPWLTLIPTGLLMALYWISRRRIILAAAGVWFCYLPYEWGMKLRILCSGECNIRVDLLLIYPLLFLLSFAAILVFLRQRLVTRN
jgi:hypothetical protein